MIQEEIKKMWDRFIYVPVSLDGTIEEDFHIWPAGTDKKIIWDWFEDNYDGGVDKLITCF